jgi:hypothetical protein
MDEGVIFRAKHHGQEAATNGEAPRRALAFDARLLEVRGFLIAQQMNNLPIGASLHLRFW